MAIAIPIALGVEAATILLLLIGFMVFKRYKTIKHPAVFKTRVRLTEGQFPGVTSTWKKCYGAWVTTVFTTRRGLPLNIADVLPVGHLDQLREAAPADGSKGLGDKPIIASFTMTIPVDHGCTCAEASRISSRTEATLAKKSISSGRTMISPEIVASGTLCRSIGSRSPLARPRNVRRGWLRR